MVESNYIGNQYGVLDPANFDRLGTREVNDREFDRALKYFGRRVDRTQRAMDLKDRRPGLYKLLGFLGVLERV